MTPIDFLPFQGFMRSYKSCYCCGPELLIATRQSSTEHLFPHLTSRGQCWSMHLMSLWFVRGKIWMFMGEIIVNLYFFTEALEEKSRLFCPFFLFLLQTLYVLFFHYAMGNFWPSFSKSRVNALHIIRGGSLPCTIILVWFGTYQLTLFIEHFKTPEYTTLHT